MEYKNWILKKYSNIITPKFKDIKPYYIDFMLNNGVHVNTDLSKSETFINWSMYPEYHSFWYYFVGCETAMSERLRQTEIIKYKKIIMDFGSGEPVCEIATNIFIENWLDFVMGARYLTTVTTENAELIMEFIKGDFLNSNFII